MLLPPGHASRAYAETLAHPAVGMAPGGLMASLLRRFVLCTRPEGQLTATTRLRLAHLQRPAPQAQTAVQADAPG